LSIKGVREFTKLEMGIIADHIIIIIIIRKQYGDFRYYKRRVRSEGAFNHRKRPEGAKGLSPNISTCIRCNQPFVKLEGNYYGGEVRNGQYFGGSRIRKPEFWEGLPATLYPNQKICPECKRKERMEKEMMVPRLCAICGSDISHKRRGAKTCSDNCRKSLSMKK
jgi:hypothetical protein